MPAHLLACSPARLLTCSPAHLLACSPARLLARSNIHNGGEGYLTDRKDLRCLPPTKKAKKAK